MYVNEKFCAISQYSEDELFGRHHRILNSGHPKAFPSNVSTIANSKLWHGEIENRTKDGSFYWVDATLVYWGGRQTEAIRADITERKKSEDTLEASRDIRMRFKDKFLSHVSHEFSSPLTAIKTIYDHSAGGLASKINSTQREFHRVLLENILQLQPKIDDLLDVTSLEAGKLRIEPEQNVCIECAYPIHSINRGVLPRPAGPSSRVAMICR